MALIRQEDKEIIHNLALLGMLFGAVVGGFLVLNLNNRAYSCLEQKEDADYTESSLVRLSSNLNEKEASIA